MNKRELGSRYEEAAARFLESRGYEIIERNYRCRQGEIDLIAKEGEYVVFVEVKYRSGDNRGGSIEAVTPQKQRRISKAALHYLMQKQYREDVPCRFDVVGVDGRKITLLRNAFDYCR